MNQFRRLSVGLFLAVASVTVFSGCGDLITDGKSCETIDDCKGGVSKFLCVKPATGAGVCRLDCSEGKERDCTSQQVCTQVNTTSGKVGYYCAPKSTTTTECSPACTAGQTCDKSANPPVCKTPTGGTPDNTQYFSVVVVDTSTGDKACGNGVDDKGADIYAIQLTGSDGTSKAWAAYSDAAQKSAAAGYQSTTFLTGSAPTLKNGQCLENGLSGNAGQNKFSSLGCGGVIVAKFATAAVKGDKIRVYEYGTDCGGTSDDTYKVLVCKSQNFLAADISACKEIGSGLTGITNTSVQ